jgi:hypothetical protein
MLHAMSARSQSHRVTAISGDALTAVDRAAREHGLTLHLVGPAQLALLGLASARVLEAQRGAAGHVERIGPADSAAPWTNGRCGYAVLSTSEDDHDAWLSAGKAVSEVLLTAACHEISMTPMTNVIEVPAARAALRELVVGGAYPMVVLRTGAAARSADGAALRSPAECLPG